MRLFAFVLLTSLAVAAPAQTVLTSTTYHGHTYSLLSNSNWTAAEAKAVSMGGHLATINDAAENQFVFDSFSTYGGVDRNLWIGLNDAAQEGTFVWSSGETSSYRNWAVNQPDNHLYTSQGEDYVHLLRPGFPGAPSFPAESGRWNDLPDIAAGTEAVPTSALGDLYGVVEVAPEPAPLAALGLGALALLRRRRN